MMWRAEITFIRVEFFLVSVPHAKKDSNMEAGILFAVIFSRLFPQEGDCEKHCKSIICIEKF